MTEAFGYFAGKPPDDDITVVLLELGPAWTPKDERDVLLEPIEGAS